MISSIDCAQQIGLAAINSPRYNFFNLFSKNFNDRRLPKGGASTNIYVSEIMEGGALAGGKSSGEMESVDKSSVGPVSRLFEK